MSITNQYHYNTADAHCTKIYKLYHYDTSTRRNLIFLMFASMIMICRHYSPTWYVYLAVIIAKLFGDSILNSCPGDTVTTTYRLYIHCACRRQRYCWSTYSV